MNKIAALYVDPKGVYANLPGVEVWDEARDARLYAGPWPVVAHPPCARWCQLAPLVEHVYGYRIGDDGGTFLAALNSVHNFGGVLEHPEHSRAFREFGLPIPATDEGWTGSLWAGWTCRVEQGHYGFPARKPTWLYVFGCSPAKMRSRRSPRDASTGWWIGEHAKPRTAANRLRRENSSRTPPAFRDVLCAMAASAC